MTIYVKEIGEKKESKSCKVKACLLSYYSSNICVCFYRFRNSRRILDLLPSLSQNTCIKESIIKMLSQFYLVLFPVLG